MQVQIQFDDGCRPNPGNRYGSWRISLGNDYTFKTSRVQFGWGTNNEAEFLALERSLVETLDHMDGFGYPPSDSSLLILTDSMIVLNRLMHKNGIARNRVQNGRSYAMFVLAGRCLDLMGMFGSFEAQWQGRNNNVLLFGH